MLYEKNIKEQLRKLPKEISTSFDTTWPHGRLRHNSKHCASAAISSRTGKTLSVPALSKSHRNVIGTYAGTSAGMESVNLQYHVYNLNKKGKKVTKCIVDGDTSTNATKKKSYKILRLIQFSI